MAKAQSMTKAQIITSLAEATGLSRSVVTEFFHELTELVRREVSVGRPFIIPGLVKIFVRKKPATKERMGTDPFTKRERLFKAKPARKVVKIRTLKRIKDAAN